MHIMTEERKIQQVEGQSIFIYLLSRVCYLLSTATMVVPGVVFLSAEDVTLNSYEHSFHPHWHYYHHQALYSCCIPALVRALVPALVLGPMYCKKMERLVQVPDCDVWCDVWCYGMLWNDMLLEWLKSKNFRNNNVSQLQKQYNRKEQNYIQSYTKRVV